MNNHVVQLKGSPQEIGIEYGKRFADNIRAENETLDLKINPGNLERIKKYTRILQRNCPWWLEEAAARARGSDIPEELILLANCMKVWPEKVEFENNCTAFLAMGDQTPDGSIYLLKNRDYRICDQVAGTMEMDGTYRYIYGSDIDNLGIAFFLNEKGLAGGNNTGGPIPEDPDSVTMSDCHALRLLAERAADCDQALEIMRELVGRSDAGYGGYQRGMIFVLTDARGKAILVETTMSKIAWRWIESGKYVITNHYRIPEIRDLAPEELMGGFMVKHTKVRFERGRELLAETGRIGLEEMMRFARDPENPPWHICNAGERLPFKTVSGFICRTEPSKDPQSWIANGCPSEVPFLRWGWDGMECKEGQPENETA